MLYLTNTLQHTWSQHLIVASSPALSLSRLGSLGMKLTIAQIMVELSKPSQDPNQPLQRQKKPTYLMYQFLILLLMQLLYDDIYENGNSSI